MRLSLFIIVLSCLPDLAVATTVQVELETGHRVLTPDDDAELAIEAWVRADDGALVDPGTLEIHSTAGAIRTVERVDTGHYSARLAPPEKRFPQVAVITAAAGAGPHQPPTIGTAVLTYSARIVLEGKSEPGARMWLTLARRRTPAISIGEDGTFSVPIEVQPGERWATAISEDQLGNRSQTRIDLYLPAVRRAHAFVYPAPVPAGALAWLFITSVASNGAPEERTLDASVSSGVLAQPTRLSTGVTRYRYRAPQKLVSTEAKVEVDGRTDTVSIPLTSGPLSTVRARGGRAPLGAPVGVELSGADRFGNPVQLARVEVDGRVVELENGVAMLSSPRREGRFAFELRATDTRGAVAESRVAATWHRPLALELTLRWVGPHQLLIEAPGRADALEGLEIDVHGAELVARDRRGAMLLLQLDAVNASTRVVARDPRTGTSAWIGR